jgi:acetylornithine/succinyldiaminopimelate/putrescine aminotransferase
VTAASLEVLKVIAEEKIVDHCRKVGDYFRERLWELKNRHAAILDVRGIGLLLGMKLNVKGAPIVGACLKKGFLINCVQEDILRFIPPLVVRKEEIDALVICLDEIFDTIEPT